MVLGKPVSTMSTDVPPTPLATAEPLCPLHGAEATDGEGYSSSSCSPVSRLLSAPFTVGKP